MNTDYKWKEDRKLYLLFIPMTEQERTEAGDPIYRYEDIKPKEFAPPVGEPGSLEAISDHIEKHIGPIESVLHEIVSDQVHIDIHWVKASEDRPYHAFVTSGMSEKPMNIPDGHDASKYAELIILLPTSWVIEANAGRLVNDIFKDETNYWPIRWLKIIARFPHLYNTWMGYGHTMPNGEEAAPFADNTQLGCMLLFPSISLGEKFFELKVTDEKTIQFYCLYPLYKEEMEYKLKKGTNALIDKFEKYDVSDIVDILRVNTCAKKGLFGLW